jgi:hypothetical protein
MDQQKAKGSVRAWESAVAAIFLVCGAIVVWDSRRLGAQWGSDGPEAGYFPFYIGVIILVASAVNLVTALMKPGRETFVSWVQLKMVIIVMAPYIVYVALIGFYEASIVFIAGFMRYLGKYRWPKIALVSIGTMVAFFLMFEVWFKVPLPKGPLEALFGFE